MTAPVQEGEILAGKYRVDKVLGAGGMGVVVAAHHIQLDERVALKFLLPEVLQVPEAVARFTREARAAVKIKSEHVARVTDVGQLENGSPYMVMEYLDGDDLSAWVAERGALPVEQAVEFVLQACEAIAEAHSLGIVHRDLKPANLFCIRRPDGEFSVKVLDFGISKALAGTSSGPDLGMTKTQAMLGSPLYMSPEQMQSARSVDARTDIWALGVILYQLLAGQVPFNGETLPELVLNVATHPPTPIRDLKPDLPAGLVQVIDRCLEKEREARYANVAELAAALLEFGPKRSRRSVERVSRVLQAAGLSTSSVALPPSSEQGAAESPGTVGSSAQSAPGTVASWGQTTPERARKTALFGTIVVVAVAILGVGAFFVHSARSTPAAAAATDPVASASVSPTTETAPSASAAVRPAPSASASASAAAVESASPRTAHQAAPKPIRKPRARHAAAPKPAPSPAPKPAHKATPKTYKPAAAPKYNPLDHL